MKVRDPSPFPCQLNVYADKLAMRVSSSLFLPFSSTEWQSFFTLTQLRMLSYFMECLVCVVHFSSKLKSPFQYSFMYVCMCTCLQPHAWMHVLMSAASCTVACACVCRFMHRCMCTCLKVHTLTDVPELILKGYSSSACHLSCIETWPLQGDADSPDPSASCYLIS